MSTTELSGKGHSVCRAKLFSLESSFSRNDGRCLDFNLRPRLQQVGDDDQGHCWKMAADDPAIGFANFLLPCNIGRLVGHEPGQAGQMTRLSACLGQDLHDIREGAFDLGDEVVTDELARSLQPIWPATNTWRPSAATPLE